MQPQHIICLNLEGGADTAAAELTANGWSVTQARDVGSAMRILTHGSFHVGLLIVGARLGVPASAVEALVSASDTTQWVALCQPDALGSADFRDLVLNCFLDVEVLPLDWSDL